MIASMLLALTTVSCRTGPEVRRPLGPAYDGPVSAEALAGRIAFSGIPGLRAEIEANLYKGKRRVGAFKGALVMRPPDDMRVVLYDSFGNSVMDLVRADGSLEILVPSKDSLYLGHAPSMMPTEGSEMSLALNEEEDSYGQGSPGLGNLVDGDLAAGVY